MPLRPIQGRTLGGFRGGGLRMLGGAGGGPVDPRVARRTALSTLANTDAGQWYLMRGATSREYHFVRSLGSGRYVGQTFEDHYADPGSTRTLRMRNTVIGPLVRLVQDNAGTYAGGTWSNTPPEDITLGYKPETFTINTTAGSAFIDVPGGGLINGLHTSRRITIPGAGVGGADMQLNTTTFVNANRVNIQTAPSVSLTGITATMWARQKRAQTSGATATWTSPAGATTVGFVATRHPTSGGLATVSVDGSLTAANTLPTAQQLVDRGIAAAGILTTNGGTIDPTTRMWSAGANALQYAEPIVVATGLAPGAHTVVVTCTGNTATGMTDSRVFVNGWLWADGTETPTMGGDLRVGEVALVSYDAAQEVSIEHDANGAGTAVYVGSRHGYETTQALTFAVDGSTVTPGNWQAVAVSNEAVITKTTRVQHPAAPSTDFAEIVYTYRLNANGLQISKVTTWLTATTVSHDYPFMLAVNGWLLDRAQLDANQTVITLNDRNDSEKGNSESTSVALWDADGSVVAAMLQPNAVAISQNWSDPSKAYVQDRALSTGGFSVNKAYIGQIPGAVTAGTVWNADATYAWSWVANVDSNFPL